MNLSPISPAPGPLPEGTQPSCLATPPGLRLSPAGQSAIGIPGNPAPEPKSSKRSNPGRQRAGAGDRFNKMPGKNPVFIANRGQIDASIPAKKKRKIVLKSPRKRRVKRAEPSLAQQSIQLQSECLRALHSSLSLISHGHYRDDSRFASPSTRARLPALRRTNKCRKDRARNAGSAHRSARDAIARPTQNDPANRARPPQSLRPPEKSQSPADCRPQRESPDDGLS